GGEARGPQPRVRRPPGVGARPRTRAGDGDHRDGDDRRRGGGARGGGVDAIVATGVAAAGHRTAFLAKPEAGLVGTFSLVPQVVDAVDVPVIAAGGIADRRGVRAAFALGASAVQVGTAFLAARESAASPAHRDAIRGSSAEGTVLTRAMS